MSSNIIRTPPQKNLIQRAIESHLPKYVKCGISRNTKNITYTVIVFGKSTQFAFSSCKDNICVIHYNLLTRMNIAAKLGIKIVEKYDLNNQDQLLKMVEKIKKMAVIVAKEHLKLNKLQ